MDRALFKIALTQSASFASSIEKGSIIVPQNEGTENSKPNNVLPVSLLHGDTILRTDQDLIQEQHSDEVCSDDEPSEDGDGDAQRDSIVSPSFQE